MTLETGKRIQKEDNCHQDLELTIAKRNTRTSPSSSSSSAKINNATNVTVVSFAQDEVCKEIESSSLPWSLWSFVGQPRALYSTTFIWISIVGGRFLAPFLEHECQLDAQKIGMLLGIQQLAGIPAGSWAGQYADALERKRAGGRARVLGVGIAVGTVVYLLHAVDRVTDLAFFQSLAWFVMLRILFSISSSMIFPVLDGITMDYLGDCKEHYGKERLFGAITWAITNLCMAPALDRYGFGITYYLGIISCVAVFVSLGLYQNHHTKFHKQQGKYAKLQKRSDSDLNTPSDVIDSEPEEIVETRIQRSSIHSSSASMETFFSAMELLRHLLFGTGRAWFFGPAFLFAFVLLAAGQVIVDNLIFLYFEWLGSTYVVMGMTVVLTVAFEIPLFHIASKLLEKFGANMLLQMAMVCYMVRVLGYTMIPQGKILYVLLLEPMHGVTYACSAIGSVDYVAQAMPHGYEATGQGIVFFLRSIGNVVGLIFGGWAEDALGPRSLYRYAALMVAIGCIVFGMAMLAQKHHATASFSRSKHHKIANPIESDLEMTESSSSTADNESE